MKNLKKVLALVLAVVMIMGTVAVASAKDYTDVKSSDNYADAIDILSSLGILDGFTDGTFKPEGTLTRAQAAKMVAIVHNAATKGVIKGQDAISDLYGNAQNAFTDCTGNWAVAYINYCRATGLLDGITRTTYAPNSKLTGVQWLKLMLTTLNFDTSKEGYLGAGWDVNVLNRANEVGLLAGLAKGWKGDVPVTRGEAAQILVNALNSYLVEYGQLIKGYPTTEAEKNGKYPYKASFVSNEQVSATEKKLGEKAGLSIVRMYDVFGRPGYKWANLNSGWSRFYMDAPLASFTTATTACDILVAAGIPKTSTKPMTFDYFLDGQLVKTDTYTHVNKACEANALVLGNTGALLQVFSNGKNNVIVTCINTRLAKITNVDTNAKHGNLGGHTDLTLYTGKKFDNGTGNYSIAGMTEYAKGYVLTYASLIEGSRLSAPYAGNIYTGDAVVETSATSTESHTVYHNNPGYFVVVKAAESKDQKLTGRALSTTAMLTVDGVKTPTAAMYVLDEGNVQATATVGKTLTFFRDQYDNLIGDKEIGTEYSYGVVTGIVWITNGASYSDAQFASAGFVNAGANEATDIKVVKAGKGTIANVDTLKGTENLLEGTIDSKTVATVKAQNQYYTNNVGYNNWGVVRYVESDGSYTLIYNAVDDKGNAIVHTLPSATDISATKPQLAAGYIADENTVFTVRTNVGGKDVYTSYTGIKNVPTIKGATVVVVRESATSFVSFVYVDARNAIFAGSSTVAYVYAPAVSYEEKDVYYTYDGLFINGEKTSINVPKSVVSDPNTLFAGTGLYKLGYNADATQVIKVAPVDTTAVVSDTIAYVSGYVVRATNDAKSFNAENAKVYFLVTDVVNGNAIVDVEVKTVEDLAGVVGATFEYTYSTNAWNADVVYVHVAMD